MRMPRTGSLLIDMYYRYDCHTPPPQSNGRRTHLLNTAASVVSPSMWMSTSTGSNPFVGAARSTAASGAAVYEGERAMHEYLQFHFGRPEEILPYECGPTQAVDFTKRCADLCIDAVMGTSRRRTDMESPARTDDVRGAGEDPDSNAGMPTTRPPLRVIDIGCAVGGISFELTRVFDEVIGVDYSASFVQAARRMQEGGRMPYQYLEQGSIVLHREALLPKGAIPSRARFEQGDACALDVETLGAFDVVLASNLLCRLPKPRSFLADLPALVKPGGVAVLISPYSWLAEYTSPAEWLGGFREGGGVDGSGEEGKMVDSFDMLRSLMEADGRFELENRVPMPFLMRNHARLFQWGCSDGTVWRRRE